MPDISIITPALVDSDNKKQWIIEAVESVRSQFFEDWEMIIVDDCSPIGFEEDIKNIGDDRIRYVRMVQRSGPALCRNTAASLARADCLLPLDSDDILASADVLSNMYNEWKKDKTKIIYGDLQRIGTKPKKLDLPDYTFIRSLDLNGIMPVTSMHSKECFEKSGGWKPEIEAGLEDVEYWISAGKAGYCGRHIDFITLDYRKHDQSRTFKLQRESRRESEMRNLIKELHTDVYEGRYPMGCCGGGRSAAIPRNRTTLTSPTARITTLDQFGGDEKVWVQYTGKKSGTFGVIGPFTGVHYWVQGPGHKLEVHTKDLPKFNRGRSAAGRDRDFAIGVPAPNGHKAETVIDEPKVEAYKPPAPKVGTLERLDRIAANG